jgi:outer membrane protein assembly factor BamE (lipoprotein component of BamABCDE complex)
MRYALAIVSALLCVSSCNNNSGLSTEAIAENNISNLSRISIGMSQSQIASIMRKPYRQESFEYGDNDYDVWFYITRMTALGQTRMVPQNLTPLVFQDGVLVGWGFGYYNRFKSSMNSEETKTPQAPSHQQDRSLEKTLQTLNETTTKTQEATPPEKPYIDDQGEKMIEEENEQNFDFW